MASEEQYLDDLLKSMMDNKPDSMEDAMQDMNKAENKPSDFSTEDLNSMLDELEHTEPDRPADMAEDSEKPEEVVDAGEEEIIGAPVEEPIEKPEEPVIDVEPDELIEEPEESKAEPVSEAAFENTEKKTNQEIAEVSQDENADDSGWKPVESVETTGDAAESGPKEAWKSDLDDLLMSMKDQDGEQEPEPQEVEEKSAENHTEDENRQLGKDQSEEDVTGLLDQMAGTDEDLSDINEMLKKVDNNESLDTSDADMLALLEGIKEAPSEGTSAEEGPAGAEDSEEEPKAKKKKEKSAKKEKKEKKPRKKLFGKSKAESVETGDAEGEANQENGESADEVGFMTDEGAEVSLDDALDSIRDKDAEAGMEKKSGFFARLWHFLTEEAEEIEDEVSKGAENATGENAEIIKELDNEDANKKKKKDKKKKSKKAGKAVPVEGAEEEEGENAGGAPAKKKKKKEKKEKEKKEKEKRPPEPKVLTRRATIVLVAFCATLIAAITFLSSFLPEYADKAEARRAFYAGDYKTVYEQLNNKKLGSSDEIMFQRAVEVLSLQHKLDSYQNRIVLGKDMEALDALFQGVDLYIELAGSDTSGALDELTEIYQQICTILQDDYGVSPEEAVEINGYDNATYTRKLDSILHGTEFYLPGEEPVEETRSVPEDVLPDEEAFIDMGDNV